MFCALALVKYCADSPRLGMAGMLAAGHARDFGRLDTLRLDTARRTKST